MSAARIDIEAIVREVLQALDSQGAQASSADSATGPSDGAAAGPPVGCPSVPVPKPGNAVAPPSNTNGQLPNKGDNNAASGGPGDRSPTLPDRSELVVSSRVVTLEQVADRLDGVRRLVVSARAVITPAVNDELVARGVQVVRRADQATQPSTTQLAVWVLGKRFDPAALLTGLQSEGVAVTAERADCLIAATDAAAGAITGEQTPAAVITRQPAAAVCLANRHPGVRAVWAVDPAQAEAQTSDVGANLLVLDPVRLPVFQMKQILARFARGGIRRCPDSLKSRLG